MLSFSLVVVSLKPLLYRFKKAANLLTRLAVLKLKKDQEIEKGPGNWNGFKKRLEIKKRKINWIGTPKIKRLPKLANLERSSGHVQIRQFMTNLAILVICRWTFQFKNEKTNFFFFWSFFSIWWTFRTSTSIWKKKTQFLFTKPS